MALIEVTNLKYRYPHTEKLALDGLDFLVEKGSFIGIVVKTRLERARSVRLSSAWCPRCLRGLMAERS